MKNLKKITALVIVLAMALSSVAFAAAFSDVAEDASYNEAVQVMASLGLLQGYEDGTFGPDKTITRAEFSAVIVRALGMEDAAAGASVNTIFPDVPASHWASGYVQVANQQGIVMGYEDGTFGPDDEVLYEQAVTMIERALNYDIKFADVEDAYPTSYLAQANADNITVGATGKIGDKATRAIVARLVYNALDVPMLVQTTIGGIYGDQYAVSSKGETLLTSKLKVAKVEGTVDSIAFNQEDAGKVTFTVTKGDNNYDLYYGGAIDADLLDSTTDEYLVAEGVDVTSMRGYTTVAYLDLEDEDEPVIAAIAPKAGKNETLTLTKKQVKSSNLDEAADGKAIIEYYKNDSNDDKDIDKKLSKGFVAYENLSGQVMDAADFDALFNNQTADFNSITLISNDGSSSSYEVAIVEKYESFVVSSVNVNNGRITKDTDAEGTYLSSSLKLDEEDEALTWSIRDTEGKELTIADIKEGDVINVATSVDAQGAAEGKFYDIIVSNAVVSGTIAEQRIDGDIYYYTIGDAEYKVVDNAGFVKVGDEGAFTVDMAGNILKVSAIEGGNIGDFAFIIGMEKDKEFNTTTVRMSIVNQKGEFSVVTLAEKVRFDGVQKEVNDTVYTNNIAPMLQTLVGYKLNAAGEVSYLYTDMEEMNSKYTLVKNKSLTYKGEGELGSYYAEDGFSVINVGEDIEAVTKDGIDMVPVAGLEEDVAYNVYYMVVDASDNILVAVGKDFSSVAAKDSIPMIVNSVGTKNDSNGDPATLLTGYVDGEVVKVVVVDDAKVVNVDGDTVDHAWAKGDIIQYVADANGETEGVRVLVSATELTNRTVNNIPTEAISEEGFEVFAGTVYEIKNGKVYFNDEGAKGEYSLKLNGALAAACINLTSDGTAVRSIDVDATYVDMDTTAQNEGNEEANKDKLFVVLYEGDPIVAVYATDNSNN